MPFTTEQDGWLSNDTVGVACWLLGKESLGRRVGAGQRVVTVGATTLSSVISAVNLGKNGDSIAVDMAAETAFHIRDQLRLGGGEETLRLGNADGCNVARIFVPCNARQHWYAYLIDLGGAQARVSCISSLATNPSSDQASKEFLAVKRLVDDLVERGVICMVGGMVNWPRWVKMEPAPQQSSGSAGDLFNCGVYVAWFLESIILGKWSEASAFRGPLSSERVTDLRRRIVINMVRKRWFGLVERPKLEIAVVD